MTTVTAANCPWVTQKKILKVETKSWIVQINFVRYDSSAGPSTKCACAIKANTTARIWRVSLTCSRLSATPIGPSLFTFLLGVSQFRCWSNSCRFQEFRRCWIHSAGSPPQKEEISRHRMPISSFREWQVTNYLENPLRRSNKSLFFFFNGYLSKNENK